MELTVIDCYKKNNKKVVYLIETFILIVGIISGILELNMLSKIFLCIFWVISLLGISLLIFYKDIISIRELAYVFFVVTLFYDLYAYKVWKDSNFASISKILLISLIFVNIDFIVILFSSKFRVSDLRKFLKENIGILCLCSCFVLINIGILHAGYTPDAYTYYFSAKEMLGTWDFTLSGLESLQMAGHLTNGYTIFVDIGLLLWGNEGIRIINLIMASITIFCFYKIVCFLFKNKTIYFKISVTMIFAFSPLNLGIVHSINSDFPMLCFFVWMVYADCYNRKILKVVFSFLLCFSKEVGNILLALYLLGDCIYYIYIIKKPLFNRISLYFRSCRWFSGFGILFFSVLLLFGGSGWGENAKSSLQSVAGNNVENKFLINIDYIIYKLKEIFVLNFNWLVVILFVVVIGLMVFRKLRNGKRMKLRVDALFFPILFSFIGFFCFNLLFFTYPHYRYLQMNNFYFSLLIGWMVSFLTAKTIKQLIILNIFVITFFVQSFYSIDPISLEVFPTINIGERRIVSTKKYISKNGRLLTAAEDKDVYSQMFFDSTLCNKDQLGFGKITEKGLNYIKYDGKKRLIFPALYGQSLEYTLLAMFGRSDLDSFYWNADQACITDNPQDIKIDFEDIYDICGSSKDIGKKFYYFQYPFSYEYDEESLLKNFELLEKKPIEYRGWKLNVLLLEYKG